MEYLVGMLASEDNNRKLGQGNPEFNGQGI